MCICHCPMHRVCKRYGRRRACAHLRTTADTLRPRKHWLTRCVPRASGLMYLMASGPGSDTNAERAILQSCSTMSRSTLRTTTLWSSYSGAQKSSLALPGCLTASQVTQRAINALDLLPRHDTIVVTCVQTRRCPRQESAEMRRRLVSDQRGIFWVHWSAAEWSASTQQKTRWKA